MEAVPGSSSPDLSDVVRESLESHGLTVIRMPFPQNIHHDEFGYHRALIRTLSEIHPRLILPVGDALSLARFRRVLDSGRSFRLKSAGGGTKAAELPRDIVIACDSEENIARLSGKCSFNALASELGIRVPRTYSSASETGLPHATGGPGTAAGPDVGKTSAADIIFKRDISYGGHGVHRPRTVEALERLIAHQRPGEPYLIQDFIPGEDFSVDAVRFPGSFFRASSYRVTSSSGNGPSVERTVLPRPDLEETARRIMDGLDCRGLCGFDFRVTAEGVPYVLECNPRFTGGLSSQIAAGFDIPYLLYRMYLDESAVQRSRA